MKVALLTDGIYPFVMGGLQKHSYYLAKFLAKNKVQVDLYHCVANEKSLAENLEGFSAGELKFINHTCLRFPSAGKLPGHYLKESWKYASELFVLIKSKLPEYDFIYAKGFTAWKLLAEKQKGLKCPPVGVNFHGLEMFQPAPALKSKIEQLFLRDPVKWNCLHSDHVFSYGGKITDILTGRVGVIKERIIEIPAGIEKDWLAEETRERGTKIKFLFIGRYERRKGIEELNSVLKQLLETADFEFHFIGPIPLKKQLVSDKIIYHGSISNQPDIRKIMSLCDVLVCPSHSEGMPNVILEAMASGLAIIATDVGAISEMIDEKNGWLISPNDKPGLKKAIDNACNAKTDILTYKKRNSVRKVIDNFTWDIIADKTFNALSNLIKEKV